VAVLARDISRVRDAIVGLLSDLVRIDSVNPSLVEGGAGEGAIAALVAGWASDHGLSSSGSRKRLVGRASSCGHVARVAVGRSQEVLFSIHADAAIVTEPTEL
jgi:acetylornithine deacetylase/succinyl-diaminopimelate desuccinylase-like protein